MREPGEIKFYCKRGKYGMIAPGHRRQPFGPPDDRKDVYFKLTAVDPDVKLNIGEQVWFDRRTYLDGRSRAVKVSYEKADSKC